MGLPWRLVLTEVSDPGLIKELEESTSFQDPLTRKRGFIQIIDSDPSRIELPLRCLPVYLLNGRQTAAESSDYENRLRRMTMLEELRRSSVREILVLSGDGNPVPPDLRDLWSAGYRSYLTFSSDWPQADDILDTWLEETEGASFANLLRIPVGQVIEEILERYAETYPAEQHVIRVRDRQGSLRRVDVTDLDEPERPVLEKYSLIEEATGSGLDFCQL